MSVSAPLPELRSQENPPFYRDIRVVRWLGQIIAVFVVLAFFAYLARNVSANNDGQSFSFAFLNGRFGSPIPGVEGSADFTILQAFKAGYLNTVRIIVIGIPACTLIGILIAIMRLSTNAMVRFLGTAYVETFRNIPALVWIFIAYFSLALSVLPDARGLDQVFGTADDVTAGGGFFVTNRGIGIPWLNPDSTQSVFWIFLAIAFLSIFVVARWRAAVNAKTGQPAHTGRYAIASWLGLVVLGHIASGGALNLEGAGGGRSITSGLEVNISYAALTIALTLYTASHVAEIVRGAILAIHKGQAEAASAIALTTFQRYRFVILPQAFRIMIPPLANQYLNITKNSSLALIISYIETAAIFSRVAADKAPPVQAVVILMGLYLSFSLSISLIANILNNRLALESR